MKYCSVFDCTTNNGSGTLAIHKIKSSWLNSLPWKTNRPHYVCQLHFLSTDYKNGQLKREANPKSRIFQENNSEKSPITSATTLTDCDEGFSANEMDKEIKTESIEECCDDVNVENASNSENPTIFVDCSETIVTEEIMTEKETNAVKRNSFDKQIIVKREIKADSSSDVLGVFVNCDETLNIGEIKTETETNSEVTINTETDSSPDNLEVFVQCDQTIRPEEIKTEMITDFEDDQVTKNTETNLHNDIFGVFVECSFDNKLEVKQEIDTDHQINPLSEDTKDQVVVRSEVFDIDLVNDVNIESVLGIRVDNFPVKKRKRKNCGVFGCEMNDSMNDIIVHKVKPCMYPCMPWKTNRPNFICNLHFGPDDYKIGKRILLKKGAVPKHVKLK